jgi:hypothetical protein
MGSTTYTEPKVVKEKRRVAVVKDDPNTTPIKDNTSYKWEPDDIFEMNGEDYSVLLQAIRSVAATGGAPVALIAKSHEVLEALLVAGVKSGVIVEVPTQNGPLVDPKVHEAVPLPGQ